MTMTRISTALAAACWIALGAVPGHAQEVTLRLHQFLPPPATLPAKVIKPWAASIEEASGGRIKFEH